MTREELDEQMQWSIPEEETATNIFNESGEHFVVVNLARDCYGDGFYIPGEEPQTWSSVKAGSKQVLDMIDEYGHNIESARLFKLVPVDLHLVAEGIREAIAEGHIELED